MLETENNDSECLNELSDCIRDIDAHIKTLELAYRQRSIDRAQLASIIATLEHQSEMLLGLVTDPQGAEPH